MSTECTTEMKAKDVVTHNLLIPNASADINLQQVIVCEDHSNLAQLLRVTAYVLRFIHFLKAITRPTVTPCLLTSKEIAEAGQL